MVINLFFDKTAIIKRQRDIAGTDRQALQATATAEANFQQLDVETTQKIGGTFGESYVLYVAPEINILEGDRVVCKETGEHFLAKEVIKAEMMGIEHFKEIHIERVDKV